MDITKEQIEEMSQELDRFQAKKFDIGIHDISDNMKNIVNKVYGDQDWSCSGYWVRAQTIVKEYNEEKVSTIFNTHSGKGIFR
jgi:hypothetical protein